jgi:hypothetical protein
MEYVVAQFLSTDIKVANWDKDTKSFNTSVVSEAFCYRNPEYHEECEYYTYVQVSPLGYEIFKYYNLNP